MRSNRKTHRRTPKQGSFPIRPYQTRIGRCEFKKLNYLLLFAFFTFSSNKPSVCQNDQNVNTEILFLYRTCACEVYKNIF